jgi:hypothetical protein
MLIKMLTHSAGPLGSFIAGQELEVGVDISAEQAKTFLDSGYAETIQKRTEAKKDLYTIMQEEKTTKLNELEKSRGKNMLIKMLQSAVGPFGSSDKGDELEVGLDISKEKALALVADKYAVIINKRTKLPVHRQAENVPETDTRLVKNLAKKPGKVTVIRMNTTAAGPLGSFLRDQELEVGVDISADQAKRFLESKSAVIIPKKTAIPIIAKRHHVDLFVFETDLIKGGNAEVDYRGHERLQVFLNPEAIAGVFDGKKYIEFKHQTKRIKDANDEKEHDSPTV